MATLRPHRGGPGGRGSAPEAGGQGGRRAGAAVREREGASGCVRPGRTVPACCRTALQKTCASILGATSSVGVAEMSLRFSGICEVSTAFHTCGVVRREP